MGDAGCLAGGPRVGLRPLRPRPVRGAEVAGVGAVGAGREAFTRLQLWCGGKRCHRLNRLVRAHGGLERRGGERHVPPRLLVLTVRLGAPIRNAPSNPFGLDFIVFGNAGFVTTNGDFTGGGARLPEGSGGSRVRA